MGDEWPLPAAIATRTTAVSNVHGGGQALPKRERERERERGRAEAPRANQTTGAENADELCRSQTYCTKQHYVRTHEQRQTRETVESQYPSLLRLVSTKPNQLARLMVQKTPGQSLAFTISMHLTWKQMESSGAIHLVSGTPSLEDLITASLDGKKWGGSLRSSNPPCASSSSPSSSPSHRFFVSMFVPFSGSEQEPREVGGGGGGGRGRGEHG